MSKKIITILLAILMIFSVCIPAFATQMTEDETEITIENVTEETTLVEKVTEINKENVSEKIEETTIKNTEKIDVVNVTIKTEKLAFTNEISFSLYCQELGIQYDVVLNETNKYTFNNSLEIGTYIVRNIFDNSDKYELKFEETTLNVSKTNTNFTLTPTNIPDEERYSYTNSLIPITFSADIKNSEKVSFTIYTNDYKYDVLLTKENNYTQTVEVYPGEYKIKNILDYNNDYETTFPDEAFSVTSSVKEIKFVANEEKEDPFFIDFLKNNFFILLLLIAAVVSLFVVRHRQGDSLLQVNFKKKKEE